MTSLISGTDPNSQSPVTATILSDFAAFAPLFQAIPELSEKLLEASANNWSPDQFTAALMGTNWWKSTSENARNWQIRQLTDPATASQDQSIMGNKITLLATGMGIPLSHGQVTMLTEAALAQGWSDQQLQQQVVQQANEKQMRAGAIQDTRMQLNNTAAQYGLNLSDDSSFKWAKQIEEGGMDQKSFESYAAGQAAASHPYWSKQLNEGITLRQLADPYIQSASQLLGVSADSIDLSQSKWGNALIQRDKNGQVTGPMSQLQWEQKLMTDPSYGWQQTDNARQAAFQMVDQLQKSFGAAKA